MQKRGPARRRPIVRLLAVLPFAMAIPAPGAAQTARFDIHGTVADSAGSGLGGAMVVALTRADSVLVTFATSANDGAFTLRRLPAGDYVPQVTTAGYEIFRKDIAVLAAGVDAGTITMTVRAVELDPLEVSVDLVPFINRGDTLVYNTLAYPTRPNASVEELLSRLPGIQVDADGSIRALGEQVTRVLVEGREFFGSDPTIATRNLPADAVKRVEVYDKASDLEEFTGVPDGNEERTIDLELQDGAKQGWFGRLAGALGADGGDYGSFASGAEEGVRYDQTFGLNRFTTTTQIAAIASANNVNQPGFSWADYQGFVGGAKALAAPRGDGGSSGAGRDDGFTETVGLGVNASHDFAAGSWIRSSYFLSSLDNLQNRTVQQRQLLGAQVSSLSDGTNSEAADNLTHRFDLNTQYTIGEAHHVRLRADFTRRSSSLLAIGSQETRTASRDLLNSASTLNRVEGTDLGGSAALTWRKRLNRGGRTVVAEVRANLSEPDLVGRLESTTTLASRDPAVGTAAETGVVQEQYRKGRTFVQTQRLSLIQPVGESLLEVFGEHRVIDEDRNQSIYDLTTGSPVFNDPLSSEFERTYRYFRGGLNYTRPSTAALVTFGLQVQGSDLDGTIIDRDERIANGYTHVLPTARVKFQLGKPGRSIDVRYATATREPGLEELQPFTDNTNPLSVYTGNPDLQPEYTHSLSADYRFFDQFSFVNLYTYARLAYTRNDIALSRDVDENGLQRVSPINAGPRWAVNGGATWDTPIRRIAARLTLGYDLTWSRGAERVNGADNVSRILTHTASARIENRYKENVDLQAGGQVTFNRVDYSLFDGLDQSWANGAVFTSASWYAGESWTLASSLSYRAFDQDVFGAADNIAFLDASISRLLLDDRAEIRLAGLDLLDQNQGVAFTSSTTAIRETRTRSLGRRLMLNFTYRLGRVGSGIK